MIREFDTKYPQIAASAFVSEAAYVVGDVQIGTESNIWPGAVIRGDCGKITIGNNTSIEDNSVVHGTGDMIIGDNVIVGHGAVVHGYRVGNFVLVGNNAVILNNAVIGDFSISGAGSVVPEGMKVPDVLLSGHHEEIENWRLESSLMRTLLKRADLLQKKKIRSKRDRNPEKVVAANRKNN